MEGKKEQSSETREGQIIEAFEWKGKAADIRFAKREDGEGLALADKDRAEFRLKEYKMEQYRERLEKGLIGDGVKQNLEESLAEPDKSAHVVLEIGDEIVGYAEFGPYPEWGEATVRIHTLSTLQMRPEYRRQGFGRKLLRQTIKQSQDIYGAKHIALNTDSWNKPAIALYKAEGFVEEGEPESENWMAYDSASDKMVESKRIKMVKDLEK